MDAKWVCEEIEKRIQLVLAPEERSKIKDEEIEEVLKIVDHLTDKLVPPEEDHSDYLLCACSGNYTRILYEEFIGTLQEFILSEALPSVEGKEGVALLTEILNIWSKYKIKEHWLLRFFTPLTYYSYRTKGVELSEIPINLICDWVFDRVWNKLRDEVIHLINLERDGTVVDRNLIKDTIAIFVEIENRGNGTYCRNFERVFLADVANHYCQSASEWFFTDESLGKYLRKAIHCVEMEERRMRYYLPQTTLQKSVEAVRYELLDKRTRHVVELIFRGI